MKIFRAITFVLIMFVGGCCFVQPLCEVECGRILIEHEAEAGKRFSWYYSIRNKDEFDRLYFLFKKTDELIQQEHLHLAGRLPAPYNRGTLVKKPFYASLLVANGCIVSRASTTGGRFSFPHVRQGERRAGMLLSVEDGKMVYELILRLELIFLNSPYAKNYCRIDESGLNIWSEPLSLEDSQKTREDFLKDKIEDFLYMANQSAEEYERIYWETLAELYESKMRLDEIEKQ